MLFNVIYLLTVVEEKRDMETMLTRKGELPFFPSAGMSIDTGEGNPREITDVLWRCDVGELAITFEDEDGFSLKTLKKWGWAEL